MEKHLYYNMAQLCTCYNFAWSRWNITAGRRNIVMQMREYKPERTKQVIILIYRVSVKGQLIIYYLDQNRRD